MGIIKMDEVRGIRLENGSTYHVEHYKGEFSELTQDQLILENEADNEEELIFCDECGRQI